MLMTLLGGRDVGPAWQQESLLLVLKITCRFLIPSNSTYRNSSGENVRSVKMG